MEDKSVIKQETAKYTHASFTVGQYCIDVYTPAEAPALIVYLHASAEEGRSIWQLLPEPKPAFAVIDGTDWNRDLSPWPAEKVFRQGEDFSGGAEAHLKTLIEHILPSAEGTLAYQPAKRCIAGYSLAGLFALWSAYHCDAFDCVAALSPSFWFDGFTAFTETHTPSARLKRVSLSLGDREKHTRNKRMSCVEEALTAVCARLDACNIDVVCRFERGGHFDDVAARIARGIAAIHKDLSM